MRPNGLIIEYFPYKFKMEARRDKHFIVSPQRDIELTLALSRVISYLLVRKPIQEELLSGAYIELTSGYVVWYPNTNSYDRED